MKVSIEGACFGISKSRSGQSIDGCSKFKASEIFLQDRKINRVNNKVIAYFIGARLFTHRGIELLLINQFWAVYGSVIKVITLF